MGTAKIDFAMCGKSNTKSSALEGPSKNSERDVQWDCWTGVPGNRNPFYGLGLILFVVGLAALVTGKGYLALLAGAAVAVVCWRQLLPVRYQADQNGIRQTILRRSRFKNWAEVAAIRFHRNAMELHLRMGSRKQRVARPIWIPLGRKPLEIRERLRVLVPHLIWDHLEDGSKSGSEADC